MTTLLISANLLVFAIEAYLRKGGLSESALLHRFALRREDLLAGHLSGLLLHAFAHAGVGHLLGNLMALYFFGRLIERHLGPWRLFLAYALAGGCSATVSLVAQYLAPGHPSVPMLGASGAVAGLVALGVLLEPYAITFAMLLPLPLILVGWLTMATDLLALWHGTADQVDHPAHIGGYLSVSLYYFALNRRQKRRARTGLLLNLLTALLAFTLWRLIA
jgi:membrane associated rhomboid family serine protease